MATQSSASKGSDIFMDFCCSSCQEEDTQVEALFYCKLCSKFYCDQCLNLHKQLFKKHIAYDRGEFNMWPVSKGTEDLLAKCNEHEDKKLDLFCEDHGQLCCMTCDLQRHRQCIKVTTIAEAFAAKKTIDLQELTIKLHTILQQLTEMQNNQKVFSDSLQVLYTERLQEIQEMRIEINIALDKLQNATIKEMKDKMDSLNASIQTKADSCSAIVKEINCLISVFPNLKDKNDELLFLAYQKSQDKINESEVFVREHSSESEFSFIFQPHWGILKYLSKLPGLGSIVYDIPACNKQDQEIVLTGEKTEHCVKMPNDDTKVCEIRSILCLPDGNILVADSKNNKVKLLDKQFKLVSYCSMSSYMYDLCQVDPLKVAVVQCDAQKGTLQFIRLNNRKLEEDTNIKLSHRCFGIAHHQGILYVTSGTALYQYTLTGTLVRKLYEDATDKYTVYKCAVGFAGDRLYVSNSAQHKLLTLAMAGTVMSEISYPELQKPHTVHVTTNGQVLVCGVESNTVIQVDSKGKKKIVTILTHINGLETPSSVCYRENSIIVGLLDNDYILVFTIK